MQITTGCDKTRHTGDEYSIVVNPSHDQELTDSTEIELPPEHRSTVADLSSVSQLSTFHSNDEEKLPIGRGELDRKSSDTPSQRIATTTSTAATVSEITDCQAHEVDGHKLPAQLLTEENLNEASEAIKSAVLSQETVDCSMIDQLGSQTFRNEVSETEDAVEDAPDFETWPPSKRQKLSEYLQSE